MASHKAAKGEITGATVRSVLAVTSAMLSGAVGHAVSVEDDVSWGVPDSAVVASQRRRAKRPGTRRHPFP